MPSSHIDVCVYGATPAGIAASVSAAKSGCIVLLVEPTTRIGGLTASGLSHPDFRTFEAISGFYLELCHRVENYYAQAYGAESQQVADSFHGTHAEPKVNLTVFHEMLAEQAGITLVENALLKSVETNEDHHIRRATFDLNDGVLRAEADVFIDATYEGDLMSAAGIPYHVGREGRDVYQETLAPETGDDHIQGYNFRFCATRVPGNRAPVEAPPGYRREDFIDVLRLIDSGKINHAFGQSGQDFIYKEQIPGLPNGKYDINDVSNGLVRLSMPGRNLAWTDGTDTIRRRIIAEHRYFSVGLLYFLQNDPKVPQAIREEASRWGWCLDEFMDTNHLPPKIYVRESRRMIGQHVFTQQDVQHAPGDARAIFQQNSIAFSDYGINSHGTDHEGPLIGGRHTGEFYSHQSPAPPYQIPFGVLLPKACPNLLVPVAVSSSHVGFAAIRFEPTWMSLGQAAGHAAALAVEKTCSVDQIGIGELQNRLHRDRLATIYVSDISPQDSDFEAVQWWGSVGGLHGLEPMGNPAQRGPHLKGQYYQAYPRHEVKLETSLTDNLRQKWMLLLEQLHIDDREVSSAATRGDFIRQAYNAYQKFRLSLTRAHELNVLFAGDSISNSTESEWTGYSWHIEKSQPDWKVARVSLRNTQHALDQFEQHPNQFLRHDVIYFNSGLHSLRADSFEDVTTYKANLGKLADRLLATGATVVFRTTTPISQAASGGRDAKLVQVYNAAALEVMAKRPNLIVDDVYSFLQPYYSHDSRKGGENLVEDGTHWNTNRQLTLITPHVVDFILRSVADSHPGATAIDAKPNK